MYEGALELPVIAAPEQKAHQRRHHQQYARQPRRVAQQQAERVKCQRVVTRDGAVKIKQRQLRRQCAGRALSRGLRAGAAQAALPAVASCRNTYCRMPPCR
ncbi:MAG: hypothetical protein PVSMB6_06350 [Steroidobacteraceae bacterium]